MSKGQYDRVWGYIDSGKAEGAKAILGGQKRGSKGYFVDPTSKSVTKKDAFHILIDACSLYGHPP